jgi:hypothetical protein
MSILRTLQRKLAFWLIPIFTLALAARLPAQTNAVNFPPQTGDYYLYRGIIAWSDGNGVHTNTVEWKTEVLDSFHHKGASGAYVRGFPTDLSGFEPGATPKDHILYWDGKRHVFLTAQNMTPEWNALKKSPKPKARLSRLEEEFSIQIPLVKGQTYGGDQVPPRTDHFYSWYVEDVSRFTNTIPNVPRRENRQKATLVYRTNPDHILIEFVPGIGVIRYNYNHHGSVDLVDMKLVEIGHKKPTPSQAKAKGN